MSRRMFAVLLMFTAIECRAADDKAVAIAKEMMTAMGGQDAWMKAHVVRFDFRVTAGGKIVAERSHLWDKQTGRYRLEDQTKAGEKRVTAFQLNTQQGSAWVAGQKLDATGAADAVKAAYATFINDMYWLSMPWKWLDPGVHLQYVGKKQANGKEYDVVQLTFDHVGLTPGDRYDAYVSPTTHLMEHWEYKLQGGNTGSWDWEYVTTGGVKLAKNHTSKDGKSINMGDVRILDKADDQYFSDPSRTLSTLK